MLHLSSPGNVNLYGPPVWGNTVLQDRKSPFRVKPAFSNVAPMSALPPKADIQAHTWDVRFVPKADIMVSR